MPDPFHTGKQLAMKADHFTKQIFPYWLVHLWLLNAASTVTYSARAVLCLV
jgi:hypothetical protein